ncbi:MAG: hypothetical protein JWL84_2784 [Rhodospirillales bacterium]|jgi:SAM-dependent methyltransferase|nr:hypothetical protein [Rhodospirillales bacterium]
MLYDQRFYDSQKGESEYSAAQIVPFLVGTCNVRSVVDFGCGVGTWLRQFREAGVGETLGLDGEWVERDQLLIPGECFRPADLSAPLQLQRKFDIAISLEVAEHVAEVCARQFVANIVNAAPLVVFSAAVPFQGGTSHINEQWPEYWWLLFSEFGYDCFDVVRPRFWKRLDIAYYYVQNMLIFASPEADPAIRARLAAMPQFPLRDGPLPLIRHDKFVADRSASETLSDVSVKQLLRGGPGAIARALKRRAVGRS